MEVQDTRWSGAAKLSEEYYKRADELENHLNGLLEIIASKPEPSALPGLEKRVEVLRSEIWGLRELGGKLLRISSKPPLTPSLAAREKAKSR